MYYSAYQAKQNGAFYRDKYRLRYYNDDLSFIRLEHKHKEGELSVKRSVPISPAEYEILSAGGLPFLFNEREPVGPAFSRLYTLKRLRPVVSFSYHREAYVFPTGNIRLTLDSNIPGGPGVMEIKYSGFLPCFISDLLGGLPLMRVEASKYSLALENKRTSAILPPMLKPLSKELKP
jgi:hypothetical protein